jgi:hypothetical protein
MYSPPRRRRRGVWLLAVLSVTVVVVVLVTSLRSERRLLAGYIDTAQESSSAAASSAEEFLALADRLIDVDRQEFITTMARIRSTSAAADALLDAVDVPGDAVDAHARLQLAHDSWLRGLELVEGAALAAADDPQDDIPADVIERAVVELAVGDRAYEAAVEKLLGLEGGADVEVPAYPVVVFSPAIGADGLVTAARTSVGLVLRRDLAVTAVGFEPRVLGQTDAGAGIVPFTDRLIVNITVTNQGNEPVSDILLRVGLSSDRVGTAGSESRTIERLQPAESISLEFVFEVVPVANYELVINAGPTNGETDIENNVVILAFKVNEAG